MRRSSFVASVLLLGGGSTQHIARRAREVRWYTSAGSRGQIDAEKAHATGFFSCCTGFAIYPNASFTCPDEKFWQVTTSPYIENYTVDHTISICRGCDRPGGEKLKPFNWTAAQASIPAIVECADAGNITGFLIDWEPPSHTVQGACLPARFLCRVLLLCLHVPSTCWLGSFRCPFLPFVMVCAHVTRTTGLRGCSTMRQSTTRNLRTSWLLQCTRVGDGLASISLATLTVRSECFQPLAITRRPSTTSH